MTQADSEKNMKSRDLESGQTSCTPGSPYHRNSGVQKLKRILNVVFKVIFILSLVLLFCGCIWYMMGFVFLIQLVLVAAVAYLVAGGSYRFPYIVYKTAWRDACALANYLRFLYSVRTYSKKNYSVADIFKEVVRKNPNKVLFIEDKEWTAAQVDEYSSKVANVFRNAGLRKGDVVALMMENRPEFVAIWLGLSKIGVVTALINYNLRDDSLAHCINVANCSALIFEYEFLEPVNEIRNKLNGSVQTFCWADSEQKLPVEHEWAVLLTPAIADAPSKIPSDAEKGNYHDKLVFIYTSGTTGLPKAAVVTNSRFLFLAGAIRYQLGFREKDRFYTPLPLYHTAGGAMSIGQAILYGSTVVIRKKFSASQYFPDIVKHNCTVAQYIGEMCRYILSTPPRTEDKSHKLRVIFGNGLRPQIWAPFVERFKIPRVGEFYGATEGNANIVNTDNTVGAIGFLSQIYPSVYPISIIKVDPATGEPVRNKDGLCIRCKPGEQGVFIGKIIPSNPARAFLGYVNQKDSDKKVVVDVFEKGDSAFLSGDIVVCDELGYLYFKDRTGDTFRWKGENVSTSEVEAIVSNCADYRDCVVYGVEVPHCEGRAGMAAILDRDSSLDLVTLAEGIHKKLPFFAKPLFIRCLSHVEMTGTFKMKKLDLQTEGFNPNVIEDRLFYLTSKSGYEPLKKEIYELIKTGSIRF